MGSLAVGSKGQYMTGVSTDISASFVKPAGKPGDVLKMVATVTGIGKRLRDSANVAGTLTREPRQVSGVHTGRLLQC